jgi:uncharacterized protein (DUF2235 family)
MPRNLVIFCDGTCNEAEKDETNVLRLYRAAEKSPEQICYYDPGVGTIPAVGALTRISRKITMWLGAGFGYGLTDNVAEAYRFLAENYQAGDQVYILGFSRGAFTARAITAMLVECGLIPLHLANLDRYTVKAFQASFLDRTELNPSSIFKQAFSRDPRLFSVDLPVHFLGLWDTVTSVGTISSPVRWPRVTTNPAVRCVRHAISLEEKRGFFRPNRWTHTAGQDVKEIWFAGVHADVGGGYTPSESLLWAPSLFWMAREATAAGLKVDRRKLIALYRGARKQFRARGGNVRPCSWRAPSHDSYLGAWKILERFPKPHWVQKNGHWEKEILFNLSGPRTRTLRSGEVLHPTVVRRMKAFDRWVPETLSKAGITQATLGTLKRSADGYLVP